MRSARRRSGFDSRFGYAGNFWVCLRIYLFIPDFLEEDLIYTC